MGFLFDFAKKIWGTKDQTGIQEIYPIKKESESIGGKASNQNIPGNFSIHSDSKES